MTKAGLMYDVERAFRRELIRVVLEEMDGNRTWAAAALGIERTYLLRLIKELKVRRRANGTRRACRR